MRLEGAVTPIVTVFLKITQLPNIYCAKVDTK